MSRQPRDGWFLAALVLFLLLLTTSAWQHNILGMALSPFAFILIAWWRRDLTHLAARARKVRSAVVGRQAAFFTGLPMTGAHLDSDSPACRMPKCTLRRAMRRG